MNDSVRCVAKNKHGKLLTAQKEKVIKQVATLQNVEKFLGSCYSMVKEESETKIKKCQVCYAPLTDTRKVLPCTHEICESCVEEILLESASERKCPVCKKMLEEGWDTENDSDEKINSWISEKLHDYRQRCSAFLMEVVSQLCFSSHAAPEQEVVDWLMSHSFFQTTSVDIGVDFNTKFRALIFKHLVLIDENCLRAQLGKYIQDIEAKDIGDRKQYEDVLFVVLHNIEDNLHGKVKLAKCEITTAKEFLSESLECLGNHEMSTVEHIYAVAKARVGLSISAKCVNKLVCEEGSADNTFTQYTESNLAKYDAEFEGSMLQRSMTILKVDELSIIKELLFFAKRLCYDNSPAWRYLLSCITKSYGTNVVITACNSANGNINWIRTEYIEEAIQYDIDLYIACGKNYLELKDCILKIWKTDDESDIEQHRKNAAKMTTERLSVLLELAIYRLVLLDENFYENPGKAQKLKHLSHKLNENEEENRLQMICPIALGRQQMEKMRLRLKHGSDSERDKNVKCLIFHWLTVLNHSQENSCKLLQPLLKIVSNPKSVMKSYLPTMPQDELAEFREEILNNADEELTGDKTLYYQCPNGHRYEIAQCGRPWIIAKCFCGADIGGTFHNLLQSNNRDDGSDRTMKGHCLGDPNLRVPGAVPERSLTATQCSMIRFLLHCSMYLGCASSSKDMCLLIKPNIGIKSVYTYIWRHILIDIDDLKNSLSLNVDDVFMFLHGFIDNILRNRILVPEFDIFHLFGSSDDDSDEELGESVNVYRWLTKENRKQWELNFAANFCAKYIKEKDIFLSTSRSNLQASCKLLSILTEEAKEDSETDEETVVKTLHTTSKVWMYREPLSISHLKQAFQRKGDEMHDCFPILSLFLNPDIELQTIRFVPRILKLQNALLRRYKNTIYKSDASSITVAQLKRERVCGDETEVLINEVVEAWNLSRRALRTHVYKTDKGPTKLPSDIADINICDDTTIEYLLPTMDGKGVFTFALLDWLIQSHNAVIEKYITLRERGDARTTTIHPKAVTSAHLISFHPDNDLLPIILSNSSMNEEGTVDDEYNFEAIEKRFIERFISTKSKVVVDDYMKIDLMTYRSYITASSKLKELESKISQNKFETEVKTVLCSDLTDVPLVNQLLSNIDIVICFLNITGGNEDDSLNDFMVKRLQMSKNVLTPKMQQACKLKHVRSLWLTLSYHRAAIMVKQNKPTEMIFENVDEDFHQTVFEAVEEEEFLSYMQTLSKERLSQLLDVLFEFIVVELTKQQNEFADDYANRGQFRLKDCLSTFAQISAANVSVHDLPATSLCIHSLHVWVAASKLYQEKLETRDAA